MFDFRFDVKWEAPDLDCGPAKGVLVYPDVGQDCDGEYDVECEVRHGMDALHLTHCCPSSSKSEPCLAGLYITSCVRSLSGARSHKYWPGQSYYPSLGAPFFSRWIAALPPRPKRSLTGT